MFYNTPLAVARGGQAIGVTHSGSGTSSSDERAIDEGTTRYPGGWDLSQPGGAARPDQPIGSAVQALDLDIVPESQ